MHIFAGFFQILESSRTKDKFYFKRLLKLSFVHFWFRPQNRPAPGVR